MKEFLVRSIHLRHSSGLVNSFRQMFGVSSPFVWRRLVTRLHPEIRVRLTERSINLHYSRTPESRLQTMTRQRLSTNLDRPQARLIWRRVRARCDESQKTQL